MNELPQRLTAAEVAEYFTCAQSTVEAEAAAGKLRGTKIGEGWIFRAEDVAEYFARRIEAEQKRIAGKKKPQAVSRGNQPPSLEVI